MSAVDTSTEAVKRLEAELLAERTRVAQMEVRCDRLAAENARLRAALERVASRAVTADEMGVKPGVEYWCSVAEERLQIARAALTGDTRND
jgi:hypothetical protein